MAKTRIRRANAADFPVLLKIDEDSFPTGIAYDARELSYFINRRGAVTLVAEDDDEIAGFLIVHARRNTNTATMITLDIRSQFQRRGFAAQLLEESEKILVEEAISTYDLQVDVENSKAIAFYKKHGFENVRLLRKYYSNGHDAYLMVKKLPPIACT